MLQPFAVIDDVLDFFRRYVRAGFPFRNDSLDTQRERLIDEGLLWAEMFVSLGRPGTTGPELATLADQLDERTLSVPWGFDTLYAHQAQAIERLASAQPGGPQNTLVFSGTGSGKTESFLIPIIDACIRADAPGIKAVLIYPMNALANDQLKRLGSLLVDTPDVSYGRYTGDSPETDSGDRRRPARPSDAPENLRWSRQAMRDEPPDILLTNYVELEYLLLRGKDAELFRHGVPTYLVVDEIHLFAGVLGAEVAALLRRFRQHVGSGNMACVGTSATAGVDELPALVHFASQFFGSVFDESCVVQETPAPLRDIGPEETPVPALSEADLAATHTEESLVRLARATLGLNLAPGPSFAADLGARIDRFRTVGVVERALSTPSAVSAAAAALGQLPDRAGVCRDDLVREARAIILLGAAAWVDGAGEAEPEPRFRPRVHQVVRSLAGLRRCLNSACGFLLPPDSTRCPECSDLPLALSLASCRTCGEAYWSSPVRTGTLLSIEYLEALEPPRGFSAVFLAAPEELPSIVEEDEDNGRVTWDDVTVCPWCGAFSAAGPELVHSMACLHPYGNQIMRASTDDARCPSCGDRGASNRPILLPLKGSAAASTAVITQGLSDQLRAREGEAGGRLLVFADSRQNAAQQAGYADDQGARIAVRQLAVHALADGRASMLALEKRVRATVLDQPDMFRRWMAGEGRDNFAEVTAPDYLPSGEDRKQLEQQLSWELALEFTERSRRRFSLEQEGLVVISIDDFERLMVSIKAAWSDHPFGDQLTSFVRAVVDVFRQIRAVDHRWLKLPPATLARNHGIRIGDRAVTAARGFASKKFSSVKDGVDIRSWTSARNASRLTELAGRTLDKAPTSLNGDIERLAEVIHSIGLVSQVKIGGKKCLQLDHKRVVLALRDGGELWRCNRCGHVRPTVLRSLSCQAICVQWQCRGVPEPFEPVLGRGFYRSQYTAPPRRFIVREHSGQIEGEDRLVLEERFNDRTNPLIDALACTPTLEVGVSLDDLNAVVLRNLPPTPANYAQRVGRAGRRSKVALALAHAGHGPHDSYYFGLPAEMIAGLVRAPAISLDNAPLLRRHINSLILEVLRVDLPERWIPSLDDKNADEATIADPDGVLLESTIKPFAERLGDPAVRSQVDAAVAAAFLDDETTAIAEAAGVCAEQADRFLEELRSALNRWCNRYRQLLDAFKQSQGGPGLPSRTRKDYEDRLYRELARLGEPRSPESRPLGFLGLVGFLPRYGFTADSVFLYPPGGADPIVQAAPVAVTEFAPENVVYARGKKLKIRRLDPTPVEEAAAGAEHRDNVLYEARRCDGCDYLTGDPLVKSCPECGADLVSQRVIRLTGVRGGGGNISSEDEYRTSQQYDVRTILGEPTAPEEALELAGIRMVRSAGRSITIANRGLRTRTTGEAHGFDLCTGCGLALESTPPGEEDNDPDDDEADTRHRPGCPGTTDVEGMVIKRNSWLIAQIRGDAVEIELPLGARGVSFASWRATLAEALTLGIRETMFAGRGDLQWFEKRRDDEPMSLVIYDVMPGGTGYIPKLFANGGTGFKAAASEALRRLESCDCADGCHRCLRDFWNQRHHNLLNRLEVIGLLRRMTNAPALVDIELDNERLESFLERDFFTQLHAAGLPLPTLQVNRYVGSRLITRVDAEYRQPDISIFLDGRAYHSQNEEKIRDDLTLRNQLEVRGVCVLEFTFNDVMAHFDKVIATIRTVLEGSAQEVDPARLLGMTVTHRDDAAKQLCVSIPADTWLVSEAARELSLRTANQLRAAGWRLHREVGASGAADGSAT